MSTLGQRIRKRREELGLTQTELAQRLGYKSKVSVSHAESDRDDMTTTRIRKYAKALETTPAYLMGWEDKQASQIYEEEKARTMLEAYSMRGYWAYHLLEIGDKIPKEGLNELISYADYLATKYNVRFISSEDKVKSAFAFCHGARE